MLPKAKRLTKVDFKGIRPRVIFRGRFVDVAVVDSLVTKFACVVAKKRIKHAVDRNKVKRKIYSAVLTSNIKKPKFVILYPKQTVVSASLFEIKEEIHQVFGTLQ
jgi:ribonuclease P protein component